MSSYDFVHWGGRARLDNIEQEINTLKTTGGSGTQTLAQVLAQGANANAVTITNLGAPSASTDAATKKTALTFAVAMGVAL